MVGPPPLVVIALVLVIVVTLEAVTDRFVPWGSPFPLVVLELDVRGPLVLVDTAGEVGGEADVVVLLVLERGGGDSLGVEDGGEVVVVDEDDDTLRADPVPATDVTGGLEAVVSTEGVGGGLMEGERVGTLLVGELKDELVAKDELMVTKLEMVEVEERTSGDDVEAEEAEEAEDVKLRNEVSK